MVLYKLFFFLKKKTVFFVNDYKDLYFDYIAFRLGSRSSCLRGSVLDTPPVLCKSNIEILLFRGELFAAPPLPTMCRIVDIMYLLIY